MPINFSDSNIVTSKCEHKALFEDIEVSTVCTTDSESTADSAPSNDETEWTDDMSVDSESTQEIESHLIYKEEQDVTYMIPVPKTGTPRDSSLTPITIMVVDTMGLKKSRSLLKVLFDPGSTKSLISRKALPRMAQLIPLTSAKKVTTLAGSMQTKDMVHLRDLRLPEFDKNRRIDEQKALIFDGKCRYDVILGADFLTKSGIDINYSTGTMHWFENVRPMREPWKLDNSEYNAMASAYDIQHDDELIGEDWLDSYLTNTILDAKYEKVDVHDVATNQKHLTPGQQNELERVLDKYTNLFDGTLGVYPHKKFSIEIKPDAVPKHSRPYSVPHVHQPAFKKELEHLVEIGVLSKAGTSEWGSPTFIIPKKDGRIRWISDLRELNKVVVRHQYPLPIINDILRKRNGYEYFTKLDISMQYYTFELDEASKDLCTIVTPFGKFRYNRLPMGLKCSPDFAQEVMENIFHDLEDTDVYIDDVGAFSKTWEHHIKLIDTVLNRLQENGFTINPLKCEWAVKETDWLGYWLTPTGLKPWKKKIEAVLAMEPPKNLKQLRGFIGAINYYRDMWPHRSHIMAPLTKECGTQKMDKKTRKVKEQKFKWTPEMQDAFEKTKALIAVDTMSAYPDHNKKYDIYTDASDYQLGAVLMQEGRPVAYYSKKLNGAQMNYTTMEKELLSIVMTLKEFRSMLLGADITVHTDHKNLTFDNLMTQRVLRWRCYVEEYSPTIKYIKGPLNVIADTFSRMGRKEDPNLNTVGKSTDNVTKSTIKYENFHSIMDDPDIAECFLILPNEECYLNLPNDSAVDSPLDMQTISEKQKEDTELIARMNKHKDLYFEKKLDGHKVICYSKDREQRQTSWRIALPKSMIKSTVQWYHIVTGHPGSKKLRLTMEQRYHHPNMRRYIDNFACEDCQKHKLDGKGYGLLPMRDLKEQPFEEVAVDLIGPWKVQVRGKPYEFNALTAIDTVTNLVEIVRIDKKTSEHITARFAQSWMARYPWPKRCVHDNGGEFVGWEFQQFLDKCNVKDVPTTSRNPQANSICERMHQSVGNILRTLLHGDPPENVSKANEMVDEALSIAQHAMRTSVHTTLGSSPGALVFSRDMFLNVPLSSDWHAITQKREHLVNYRLMRANAQRRTYDYTPN